MTENAFESLIEVGYVGLNRDIFVQAVSDGSKSIHFTKLIEWLTKELQYLYSLDEHVNAISTADDFSSFLMELSSFLKEIGCHYSVLVEGHINERLHSESNKVLLLNYLLTELKSARMIRANKSDDTLKVTLNESSTASDLKKMLMIMKFPKPPANIPSKVLFSKVELKLKELVSEVPITLYGVPLFTGKLSDKQWHTLDGFYKELLAEYQMRREMLLKRLDVTIQSFEWSDRLKTKSNEIKSSFEIIRNTLNSEPRVNLSDILAARKDLAILEKTSSASVRRKTKSDVNKVVIGMVPDRGGRPYEQEPPPPEMPSWQQRNNAASSTVKRGTDRRNNNYNDSSDGRRVQAGWNHPKNFHSNYHQARENNPVYDSQFSSRGGYSSGRRQGGYQNYGNADKRNSQNDQNRTGGSRNYFY